jgi:hypothetical protein
MKMIMAALTAAAVLAVSPVPASADTDLAKIANQVVELAGPDAVKLVRKRSQEPRQIEHDYTKLPLGTGEWWRQYDRERGGRR